MKKKYMLYSGAVTGFGSANALVLLNEVMKEGVEELTFGICSGGGDVAAGMVIYEFLKQMPCKILTYNAGVTSSIAATIFMAGEKRVSPPHSMFCLHGATYCDGPLSGTIAPNTELIAHPFREIPHWSDQDSDGRNYFGPQVGQMPAPDEAEGISFDGVRAREMGIVTELRRINFSEYGDPPNICIIRTQP